MQCSLARSLHKQLIAPLGRGSSQGHPGNVPMPPMQDKFSALRKLIRESSSGGHSPLSFLQRRLHEQTEGKKRGSIAGVRVICIFGYGWRGLGRCVSMYVCENVCVCILARGLCLYIREGGVELNGCGRRSNGRAHE